MINKLYESAPTIHNDLEYWVRRGKIGKQCMIYFHDDLDGIMSCIVTRDYLRKNGFEIVGYGVVNYQDGWKYIRLDQEYINIALDYAEDMEDLDIYIDHHGDFVEKGGDIEKMSIKSTKTDTGSAYEGICDQLGVPTDSLILDVIDMVDSAKYEFYDVDIETILNFNLQDIMNSKNPKMIFAGAFNQLIKRSDYRTLIEVAHNATLSVYNIYIMFKELYPANNLTRTGEQKDFIQDGRERIRTMIGRVRGKNPKTIYTSQKQFYDDRWNGREITRDGYQIIGNMAFVPNGTWANALRARAIINEDLRTVDNLKGHNVYFILLQYGGSLQIADTIGIDKIPDKDKPVLRNGVIVDNLGDYTIEILEGFRLHMDYSKTITKAGGHKGIGNISNVVGFHKGSGNLYGIKWVDIFKNKIINDLSGVRWDIDMPWDIYHDPKETTKNINEKVLMVNQIRTL